MTDRDLRAKLYLFPSLASDDWAHMRLANADDPVRDTVRVVLIHLQLLLIGVWVNHYLTPKLRAFFGVILFGTMRFLLFSY